MTFFVKGLRLWISKRNFTGDLNPRCAMVLPYLVSSWWLAEFSGQFICWQRGIEMCWVHKYLIEKHHLKWLSPPASSHLGKLNSPWNYPDPSFTITIHANNLPSSSNLGDRTTNLPPFPGALGCQHLVVHWPAKCPPSPMPRKYSPESSEMMWLHVLLYSTGVVSMETVAISSLKCQQQGMFCQWKPYNHMMQWCEQMWCKVKDSQKPYESTYDRNMLVDQSMRHGKKTYSEKPMSMWVNQQIYIYMVRNRANVTCLCTIDLIYILYVYRNDIMSEQKPTAVLNRGGRNRQHSKFLKWNHDSKDKPQGPAHSAGRSSTHEIYRPSVNHISRCLVVFVGTLETEMAYVWKHSISFGFQSCANTRQAYAKIDGFLLQNEYYSMIAGLKVELSCFIMFNSIFVLSECPISTAKARS